MWPVVGSTSSWLEAILLLSATPALEMSISSFRPACANSLTRSSHLVTRHKVDRSVDPLIFFSRWVEIYVDNLAPLFANMWAISRPMPLEAPVTRTVLSANSEVSSERVIVSSGLSMSMSR
jgi:hypothetical protein